MEVPPEYTTEHLFIYSFIIEIDNVSCFANKQAVTSPPPSAAVIKHRSSPVPEQRLPFTFYSGISRQFFFMFFAPSGMQKLEKKPRPLRILFDLIFLRTGSEFLSPSLPHHSADSGIVPDCLAELLNLPPHLITRCSFTVGASRKWSV